MNVSLPDRMKSWVEEQARGGRYGNAGDYVRDVIRRDQKRLEEIARLQSLIDKALQSGTGKRDLAEILSEARHRAGAVET